MIDGNSIKPEGLLQNLTIMIEGYAFQIFAGSAKSITIGTILVPIMETLVAESTN